VAPGLQSLDDVDIGHIAHEIRRASKFADTLDMDKLSTYIAHIRKEPPLYEDEDDDDDDYWGDEVEETVQELPDISLVMQSHTVEKQRQNEILSRLIG
jgi:hypothetical protein